MLVVKHMCQNHEFRFFGIVLAVFVGTVFILGGCSSDSPATPNLQTVSEVGTLVEIHTYSDGTIPEYEYNGVVYWGDILIAEVAEAVSVVAPNYSEFEVLTRVLNYREFPASRQSLYRPGDSFELHTCTADPVRACDQGRFYRMKELDGGMAVEASGIWIN